MSASIHAAGDSTEEAKGNARAWAKEEMTKPAEVHRNPVRHHARAGGRVKSLAPGAPTGAHACKGEINYFLC